MSRDDGVLQGDDDGVLQGDDDGVLQGDDDGVLQGDDDGVLGFTEIDGVDVFITHPFPGRSLAGRIVDDSSDDITVVSHQRR
jgi:hypothetical protein